MEPAKETECACRRSSKADEREWACKELETQVEGDAEEMHDHREYGNQIHLPEVAGGGLQIRAMTMIRVSINRILTPISWTMRGEDDKLEHDQLLSLEFEEAFRNANGFHGGKQALFVGIKTQILHKVF